MSGSLKLMLKFSLESLKLNLNNKSHYSEYTDSDYPEPERGFL
jgi:hypothetical protein